MAANRSDHLEPLLDALDALQRLLTRFNNQGVIIGGAAVGLLGRARIIPSESGIGIWESGEGIKTAEVSASAVLLSSQDNPDNPIPNARNMVTRLATRKITATLREDVGSNSDVVDNIVDKLKTTILLMSLCISLISMNDQ